MDSKNQQSFEEEWQKAFKNASMPPPDYLWDKIEQELDEEKRRRPFMFILRPSQIAAGIAAILLVVMGEIFYFNKKEVSQVADNSKILNDSKKSKIEENNSIDSNNSKTFNNNSENLNKIENTEKINNIEYSKNFESIGKSKNSDIIVNDNNSENIDKNEKYINSEKSKLNENIENSKIIENSIKNVNSSIQEKEKIAYSEKKNIQNNENKSLENESILLKSIDNQVNSQSLIANLDELEAKDFRKYGNRFVKRNTLFFDFPEQSNPQKEDENNSKFWIGLNSGGGNFNPNMQLGGLSAVAGTQADAFATSRDPNLTGTSPQNPVGTTNLNNKVLVTQPKNAIQSGLAINSGVSFGYKLSRKWHLESGLRYLRGNTILQSNTFALQEANGYANIFLADYLAQKGANYTQNANAFVADATQVNNRYEYLMIPIQASYGIGLSKKVRLDVLAGFSTDIFLNNVIQSDQTNFIRETSFDAQSNTYKPLNISGLGGVRANYLLGKHWQATVGTSYQQALFSGISSATNLRMQMRLFGVNYGVNYRF